MSIHVYFSLIPEALVVSMLPPEAFGQYYATGRRYKTRGQAAFIEVDPEFRHEYFAIDDAIARCVPHEDGSPKNSVYVSTYRVLEHLPVAALGPLHLTTAYGDTLALERSDRLEERGDSKYHLYQDLAPVQSLAVSSLSPEDYYRRLVTSPSKFIRFPGLSFVDLDLGGLGNDPESQHIQDLPYPFLHHLRESLLELAEKDKDIKLVSRAQSPEFLYRMVRTGLYVGSGGDLACYRMPPHSALRNDHPRWWRNANL